MVSCYIFNLNFQAGKVSCEHIDSSCPTPKCSHPARQKGECCPTCQGQYLNVKSNGFLLFVQIDFRNLKIKIMILTSFVPVLTDCEFEQEVHADGKVFVPAGSGPCRKCRCKVSVWGIACRKCWILEGTEKSQQKDITHFTHALMIVYFYGNNMLDCNAQHVRFFSLVLLIGVMTDLHSWEGISNTPTHLLAVSQTAPWCKFKRSLIWSVSCVLPLLLRCPWSIIKKQRIQCTHVTLNQTHILDKDGEDLTRAVSLTC